MDLIVAACTTTNINGAHVTTEHAVAALDAAHGGPVAEGNVGGGTGMNCYCFKGGTGTASRSVCYGDTAYTVGVLLQANFGDREEMIELAVFLKQNSYKPDQVQDFIPSPFDIAACMYYTGLDPLTGEPLHVARGLREKKLQKALLLYWSEESWPLAREALGM